MNNNNIFDELDYAQWLEETLKELIGFPVKGIAIQAISEQGDIYTAYHKISMADKYTISGFIQQDAMLECLKVNGYIGDEEKEE